jgi:iron complex outermembrane receptor protein
VKDLQIHMQNNKILLAVSQPSERNESICEGDYMGVVMRVMMRLGTFGLLASLWVCIAHAEESEDWILQEDPISAGNRAEPMQDSVATANTIDNGEIDSLLRGSIEQLESITPNLVIDSISGAPQGAAIAIRGIGSGDTEKSFDPAVGVFVDGVFMGNSSSRLQDVFDFERVTVLRGPQGALQGRNTTGGAIHIERTRPTGTAGVKIRLQAASYDRQQLNGVFNAPLIKEKLAGKFTVNNIKNGGNYLDNCKLGLDLTYDCQTRDENDRDYLSLTGSLLWTPTTNLSLYYIYENEVDDSNTRGLLNLSAPTDLLCSNSADNANEFCRSTLGIAVPQTLRIDIVDQNFSNESTLDGDYHTLKFDWDSGKHRLTSTAAVRSQDEVLNQDLDATSSDFFSTARQQDYEQRSWELRFQSQASDKLQTVVGSYYINSEYSLLRENPFLLQTLAQEAERARAAEAETTPDVITIPESQYQVTSQKKRSLSFFVHLSYVLSEKWTADIGVRQSRDLVSTTHQPGGTKLEDVIVLPAPIAAQRQYNEVSPQFGLR